VFELPANTNCSISIFNTLGQTIDHPINNFLEKGTYSIPVNETKFQAGLYFIVLQTNETKIIKKIIAPPQ
jgi:hypothetical protein